MSSYGPHFDSPSPVWGGGLGWTYEVENGTTRNVVPIFLCDFCTHYRPILHRLAAIHNAADEQNDRAITICHLCYSTGGLIILKIIVNYESYTSECYSYLPTDAKTLVVTAHWIMC